MMPQAQRRFRVLAASAALRHGNGAAQPSFAETPKDTLVEGFAFDDISHGSGEAFELSTRDDQQHLRLLVASISTTRPRSSGDLAKAGRSPMTA